VAPASGKNVITSQSGIALATASTSPPLLAALASWGGPTQSFALQPGSPAIGAGDTSTSSSASPTWPAGVDQRGLPRGVGATDAGALALQLPSVTGFSPATQGVGGAVVIAGSGFPGSTAVTFGGASAVFTVDGDGQITATVPTGAQPGSVAVTTPLGVVSRPGFAVGP
jgi:hypothetical protein